GGHADPRRLRLHRGVPGGALLARRAPDDDHRGDERDPAHDHRAGAQALARGGARSPAAAVGSIVAAMRGGRARLVGLVVTVALALIPGCRLAAHDPVADRIGAADRLGDDLEGTALADLLSPEERAAAARAGIPVDPPPPAVTPEAREDTAGRGGRAHRVPPGRPLARRAGRAVLRGLTVATGRVAAVAGGIGALLYLALDSGVFAT